MGVSGVVEVEMEVEIGWEGETYLNLVHLRRPYFGIALHFFNMRHPKITNANALRFPLLYQPLQRLPHLLSRLRAPTRRMYQEQIHISTLPAPFDLLDAFYTFFVCRFQGAPSSQYLSCEKDFGTFKARLAKRLAHLDLIAVELRRVDVAVTGVEGM